jgi:NADPH-dependent curcumin reductase CurA
VETVVCQIARLKGCRVVGSAGSPAKVAWLRDITGVAAGQIKWQETIVDGIANAPRAFIGLLQGENNGTMLVRLA